MESEFDFEAKYGWSLLNVADDDAEDYDLAIQFDINDRNYMCLLSVKKDPKTGKPKLTKNGAKFCTGDVCKYDEPEMPGKAKRLKIR